MLIEIIRNAGSNGVVISLILVVAYLLAIMIGITAHEVAHGFAAYKCGDMTAKYSGRLSLNPARHFDPIGFLMLLVVGFGWARPVPVNPNNFTKPYKRSMIWVSLAGILTNVILAFALYPAVLGSDFIPETSNALIYLKIFLINFTYFTFSINVSLAVFNIIPVYPLDGFNFLETVTRPYNRVVEFLRRYGYLILLGLLVLSNIPMFGALSPFSWLRSIVSRPIELFWNMIFSLGA